MIGATGNNLASETKLQLKTEEELMKALTDEEVFFYAGFMKIAALTLQRGSLREIKEILLAPDDVWKLFLDVANGWIECSLSHPKGDLPKLVLPLSFEATFRDVMQKLEKNRRKMRTNWFKPFQGMDCRDVKDILEMILEGKLLLRKAPRSEDPRDDLPAYCTWMKIEERLFDEVIREASAERVSERNDPYTIIETCGDLISSKLPLGVAYRELVIADLTASPEWDLSSFEGMFKVLFSLFPECRDIQFLLVVYLLPTAVLDFLSSFKTFNRLEPIITFKPYIGFYEPEKQVDRSNDPMKSLGFIKVVVFVSAEGKDFPECPIEKKINLHSRKPLHGIEYFLRKPGGDTKAHERMWICEKAPCWRMVDNDDLKKRGRVHPYCKRVDDIEDIIYNWSTHRSTIIDIFSGGVVLRAGLLASRQVV
ncbi:hypothetical protein R1sor_011335 [Riccia sorocarpa]|uniref:Uncharacterized protein n=1 Tax=Riccia sorocarpa TaxID=122646 RepID=A0ABD3I415_9MARC